MYLCIYIYTIYITSQRNKLVFVHVQPLRHTIENQIDGWGPKSWSEAIVEGPEVFTWTTSADTYRALVRKKHGFSQEEISDVGIYNPMKRFCEDPNVEGTGCIKEVSKVFDTFFLPQHWKDGKLYLNIRWFSTPLAANSSPLKINGRKMDVHFWQKAYFSGTNLLLHFQVRLIFGSRKQDNQHKPNKIC